MTTQLAERRKGRALTLLLIAGAMAAVAAVTVGIEMRSSSPNTASGLVLPDLTESIPGAQRIIVQSVDANYRIERTQQGWAMRDRDDYPVLSSRLAQLTDALESLRYARRMTSDPAKHERLGVTDPRQGGRGILLQIEDGRGALLVNVILGVEPNGGIYLREPDEDQTWAVRPASGELPPLRDVSTWMELQPLAISPDDLVRVEISPPAGRPYVLARASVAEGWSIASPALATVAPALVSSAAEHLTQLRPVDVRTAPAIQGAPRARVRATAASGVVIDAELIDSDNRTWLKLVARASSPDQEGAALDINNRSAAWAYALSEEDVAQLAPQLSALVPSEAVQ